MRDTEDAHSKHVTKDEKSSRWMVVLLLIVAIIFLVRYIAPQTVGEQIRRHVERQLQDHYGSLDVSIARCRVEPNIGLIFDNVKIGSDRELVRIRQIIVVASADFDRLTDKALPFVSKRTILRGVVAHAWETENGPFSLEQLFPPPKFGDVPCPRVEVHDAKVLVHSGQANALPLEIAINNAVVLHHGSVPSSQSPAPPGRERVETVGSPRATTISATGSASFADHFAFHITTGEVQTDIRGEIRNGRWTRDLVERLPASARSLAAKMSGLELRADTQLVARYIEDQPVQFNVRTNVHEGRFLHPKSSLPVQQIRGVVRCDQNGVQIETCQAVWGDARIRLKGNLEGYRQPLRGAFEVSADRLMLDQRLAAVLPERMKKTWNDFAPRGLVDIPKATVRLDGRDMKADATVVCKGVDISFERFPYPVRQTTGKLTIKDGRVSTDLISGRVGGRLMQCLFDLPTKPASGERGVFSVALDGPVAIDGELLQALTPRGEPTTKLEQFVRSLQPRGAMHLVRGTFRTEPDGSKHRDLELKVQDGSLRFRSFPYPLYNVTGAIRVQDDLVKLSDFRGSNANGGAITCDGHYRIPNAARGKIAAASNLAVKGSAAFGGQRSDDRNAPAIEPMMGLHFQANNVALDESLRSSLPDESQRTWEVLAPSGVVDSLAIDLLRRNPESEMELSVSARQFGTKQVGSDTLRMQPTALPYRLDIVNGSVRYRDGRVLIDSIRAQHGGSRVSADGGCEKLPTGRWLLTLNVHSGSRLIPDAELINALPEQMRGAIRGLDLRGPVGLRGRTETVLSDSAHPDPSFACDMLLQLEGNRIGDVGPVHALRGELTLAGTKDESGLQLDGEIRLDSMHVDDLQLTGLRGPFRIRDDQLQLGGVFAKPDAKQNVGQLEPIQGRLFDGKLRIDGNVKLSDASFNVRLGLAEAKLPVVLAELGEGKSDLTGTLNVGMNLEGLLGTRDLLRGRGRATVDNANLYQVPVLLQLLNVLSITPTEDVAFTNADIEYTLVEDQLIFNDLKLWGSLVALHGQGTMDRRYELDLTFNTRVSPRNTFTRIIRPLADQRFTFWTVDVRGPLSDPEVERRALDGVGQTLGWLFSGINGEAESKRKRRQAGLGKMLQ
jgi:hypothetical protein